MKRFFLAAAFLAVPCLLPAAEANPTCGSVLTSDTTLDGDMVCAGTALRIGADSMTVDLNGYTVTGDGVTVGAAGVRNAGFNGVTIQNGTITNFFFGIYLNAASDNIIRAVTADGNWGGGIFVENGANNNQIVECVVIDNGTPAHRGNGISINGSDGNLVTQTLAANNHTQGIFVGGGGTPSAPASTNTRILHNTSHGNVSNGIGIIGGSGHVVRGNISMDNGAHGVSFRFHPDSGPVTASSIVGNSLTGNTFDGIALSGTDGTRIVANRIGANLLSGISLLDSDGNGITGNHANGNGTHGLLVRSGADRNAFRGNEFNSNGLRGILVSPGGGFDPPADNRFDGNRALGNTLIDVVDLTSGDGTEGTDSTYRGMRCDRSVPNGTCVP